MSKRTKEEWTKLLISTSDPLKYNQVVCDLHNNDPEIFNELQIETFAQQTEDRLAKIVTSDFSKTLGEPSDFSGHDRLLFSLDNFGAVFINDKTLPLMIALMEEIVGTKLEIRICKGGYSYKDGPWILEVSFLVKIPDDPTYRRLISYIEHSTRQGVVPRLVELFRSSGGIC